MSERRVQTWEQMTLGGGSVLFHLETRIIDGVVHEMLWECNNTDTCGVCHDNKEDK